MRNTMHAPVVIMLAMVFASVAAERPVAAQPNREVVQQIREAYAASGNATSRADYEKIIATLDQVLQHELSEHDARYVRNLKGWAHNRRGEALIVEGKEAEALVEFNQAVSLNNQHWKSLHNRGVSLANGGRLDEAIQDFSRALLLKQDYANTWFNRGELLYEKGQFEKALADYNKAIELNAEDAGYYNSRGHTFYRLRKYDEAVADYDRAVELDPKNPATHVNRGDVLMERGEYEQAAKDYMQAIELDAHLGRAYQSAAWMMAVCPVERFRDAERAVAAAEKAIELDGRDDYRYLETLAAAYANAGQYQEAVKTQQQVVERAPAGDKPRCTALLELFQQEKPFRLPEASAAGR